MTKNQSDKSGNYGIPEIGTVSEKSVFETDFGTCEIKINLQQTVKRASKN